MQRLLAGDPELLLGGQVALEDAHIPVHGDDAVGRHAQGHVGKGLGQVADVGHAHEKLGLFLIDRDGLLPAGGIAAGAAVELLVGRGLADFGQDLPDGDLVRDIGLDGIGRENLAHIHP